MVDSTLAFNILARDRGASGVFEKVARSADKTSASLAKAGKISDSVAKASANLTKAHNSETDALDKVQVAEARLADVRNNSKSKTSQIISAEKALAKARRDAAAASNVAQKATKDLGDALDDEGKKAGKGLGSSLRKWFTGDGKNVFRQVGEDGGTVFGSGFLGMLKTPILGPLLVGVIGGAVTAVMPAIGAVAAGALVTGFGAGLVGLGIVFAAKSVAVKNAWNRTLTAMGADMRLLSKPFEGTLINIAGYFQRTVDKFSPALGKAFSKLAPVVDDFVDHAMTSLERLVPTIAPISDAFEDVLKSLDPAIGSMIADIADGVERLARSVSKSPEGLADLTKGVGAAVKDAMSLVSVLNDLNGTITTLTGGTSGVDYVMTALTGPLKIVAGYFAVVNKGLEAFNSLIKPVGDGFVYTATSASEAATAMGYWTQGLSAAQVAAMGTGAALDPLPGKVESLAVKLDRQWQSTQKANEALTRMSGLLLTLSGSQIAYQQAVDGATASVKENGRTHDINTEKGRANKTALDQVAASANAQMLAMRNAGDGNLAAYKSAATAREGFVKLAVQMGYTVPQAKAMAKSLIAIPNVTREARLKANKADLDTKLAAAKKQLADPKLTATKKAQLKAEIAQLLAAKAAAQRAIDSLRGKTVSIVTKYTSTGVNLTAPSSVGRRADGGPVKKGLPYIVGEEGPELVWPDQNGTVIPNSKTKAMAAAGAPAGGGAQRLELVIRGDSGSRYAMFLASELTRLLKGRGADVKLLKQLGLA